MIKLKKKLLSQKSNMQISNLTTLLPKSVSSIELLKKIYLNVFIDIICSLR